MSDSIKLRSSELELVRKIITDTIPDLEVWAFGSRVHRRQLKTFSDLDLVVFTQQGQLLDLGVLRENLTDSDLPFTVDVSSWSQLPDWLQQEILQNHVILQVSKQLPSPPFAEQQELSD
ncbi:MAG: nucleotidyltransferase domain-containing protein [Deltaproteobacteria bacterium]